MNKINLDITKYSCNELQEILDIKTIYNKDQLNNHITSFKSNILLGESLNIYEKDKISDFLDQALEKLLSSIDSASLNDSITIPTSAQILAPTTQITNNKTKLIKKVVNIDTRFRSPYYNTKSSDFHITLPEVFKKVINMTMSSINIPLTIYAINSELDNNVFSVKDGTGSETLITLDNGNYCDCSVNLVNNCPYIVDVINLELSNNSINDLEYYIDLTTHKSGFRRPSGATGASGSFSIRFNITNTNTSQAGDVQTDNETPIIMKLGWLLGFRYGTYEYDAAAGAAGATGAAEVVSEGICSIYGPKYLYLCINDFNNASSNNYVAAFTSSILSPNILARINYQSLVQSNGIYNFSEDDDSSDRLSRSREYFGLVDIQKLHIQFLDEYGRVVDFNNMDWSCELTFNSVYD